MKKTTHLLRLVLVAFVFAYASTSNAFNVNPLPAAPEIDISSNGITINDGDTTPSPIDNSDFGTTQNGITMQRGFTIANLGNATLTISSISLSNTTDFSIVNTPGSSVNPGDKTSVEIRFNSLSIGLATTTVTINNDDSDENPYTFIIHARATESFFDSDGDGVYDDRDIDDDNDGISDTDEELACKNSAISITTNYKFLNETFGFGNRTTINTTYNAVTTYCYEDGTGGCFGGDDLNDGEYTVYYKAADGDGIDDTPNGEVASWADNYWYLGEDHTPGDTNGRMAMFNASYDPGIFYTASITGALPGVPVTYSFWVINLDRTDAPGIATRLRPNILVEFRDVNDNVLASISTGDIAPTTAGNLSGDWYNFSADLTFNVSEFNVFFYNNETGGAGNDLAIDDIEITQTLCDTDSDGIADVFDLDSDNDGIPDVVEAGLGTTSNGKAFIDTWVDANSNGMHDAAESFTVLDTDGDGTPNYIDLDSDNDAIFDVDESGAGNTASSGYQNGDGDIDGDGVGDGSDSDEVREKDTNADGTSEYFSDGILDVYDYFEGSDMSTAYGNSNQGMGNTYYVLDTDNDGTPDYMDLTSDGSTFDISHTLYADLDANNDGVIDDTMDDEGDGLLNLFDTDDTAFGSPRDLDRKLQLYFDGRNDYIQDTSITGGWGEITLMGWIKIDPSGTGSVRYLFGQNNFYLRLYPDNRVFVETSGANAHSGTALPTNQWVHVGATYSSSGNSLRLYVNGELRNSSSKSGNLNSDTSNFTIGRRANAGLDFYRGFIDEVRLFDVALTTDEFQKVVYQEIEDNTDVRGTVIPRNVNTLAWANLTRYFRLDTYKGDITDDLSTATVDIGTGAKMYNFKLIDYQSAPMPFVTQQSGALNTAVHSASDGINGDDAITYDWSIVRVEHDDVTYNGRQQHLGLFINQLDAGSNPIEYHVTNDSELNVSWYLKLDGFIDLEGESQLVQGADSMLDATSIGKIEQDQQGTADTFTYNYWSSPVGTINGSQNNADYTVANVLMDGSDPDNPAAINFITNSYDGTNTSPIGLATYWIWKFDNHLDDDYSSWQHVGSTGTMKAGEGYTMKGPGTGSILTDQNYVFSGKPNNGDINLTLNAGNNYLIGNPYPSAIDADQFIRDNGLVLDYDDNPDATPTISGTLYFWEHWGGGSHILQEYQGGYATYNFSGAVAAPSYGTNDPDVGTGGTPKKLPGRYIPVGQGFFVVGENTGTLNFNNGQRIFEKEGSSSVFVRSSVAQNDEGAPADERMKFRIGFNSINTIHRQLLLTVDSLATTGVDRGFDASLQDELMDDMYWMIDNGKYNIQGYDNIDELTTVIPIGLHTDDDGTNTITIDELENVPDDLNIYIHDLDTGIYHDLRASDFEIHLTAGEYLNRFELTFNIPDTLSENEEVLNELTLYYSNNRDTVVILNPNQTELKQLELYNILGQSVYTNVDLYQTRYNEYPIKNLSTGTYILKLNTLYGSVTKKIIVK